jgi:hypothetical protein
VISPPVIEACGRVITVEPSRKPFVTTTAGISASAAAAADAFPACTAAVIATALEFSALSAFAGPPIPSMTNCSGNPRLRTSRLMMAVPKFVNALIVLVVFCASCARIEPGAAGW